MMNARSVLSGLKHQKEKRSMDYFAGLDVSVKETSVCIVDDAGKIVREARVASEPEALLQVLTLYRFKRVGLEAGPLSQWLYSVLAEAGLPVICVETRHMRAAVPIGSRPRARVRALWGLSGWRGNERIADSIKKGPPGARAGGGCCSGSDRAPNFQGSAGRERNPVRGLAQLASLWLIACPASKLRHTCSDHCCRMGADCRELDGPLTPTARLSAIGTFARSTRATSQPFRRAAGVFATSTRATGARLKLCQAQAVGRFPAESYSLPIPSFPLQPLRPHNARTRARGRDPIGIRNVST